MPSTMQFDCRWFDQGGNERRHRVVTNRASKAQVVRLSGGGDVEGVSSSSAVQADVIPCEYGGAGGDT